MKYTQLTTKSIYLTSRSRVSKTIHRIFNNNDDDNDNDKLIMIMIMIMIMIIIMIMVIIIIIIITIVMITKLTIKSYLQLISLKKTIPSKHYLHYSFRFKEDT